MGIYLKIDDVQESDYDLVKITHIGFVDEYGIEGLILLKADNGMEFHMHAFSGEVARHISGFLSGDQSVPTKIFLDLSFHVILAIIDNM